MIHVKVKPGVTLKDNEMPSVYIGDIDPAYWMDEDTAGPTIAEMRKKKPKKVIKAQKSRLKERPRKRR